MGTYFHINLSGCSKFFISHFVCFLQRIAYLSDHSQRCSVIGDMSNIASVSCDVPQGSNLRPLLFSIYINSLPNCFSVASPKMLNDETNITVAGRLID